MEKTKLTHAFWITQFFFFKFNTGINCQNQCTQRKKKYDKKSPFWVGNIAYHTP